MLEFRDHPVATTPAAPDKYGALSLPADSPYRTCLTALHLHSIWSHTYGFHQTLLRRPAAELRPLAQQGLGFPSLGPCLLGDGFPLSGSRVRICHVFMTHLQFKRHAWRTGDGRDGGGAARSTRDNNDDSDIKDGGSCSSDGRDRATVPVASVPLPRRPCRPCCRFGRCPCGRRRCRHYRHLSLGRFGPSSLSSFVPAVPLPAVPFRPAGPP